jgi:hypothetical protein
MTAIAERRAAMRKATLQLVLGVVLLDAIALGIYYLGGIEHAGTQAKRTFTWVWLVATAITVAFLLRRVRAFRHHHVPRR